MTTCIDELWFFVPISDCQKKPQYSITHDSSQYSDLEMTLIADMIVSVSVQAVLQQTLHKHVCHLHTTNTNRIVPHWISQVFI